VASSLVSTKSRSVSSYSAVPFGGAGSVATAAFDALDRLEVRDFRILLRRFLLSALEAVFSRFSARDGFFLRTAGVTFVRDRFTIGDFAFIQVFALLLARATEVLAESSKARTSSSSLATWSITFDKSASTRSSLLRVFLTILLVFIASYSYS
jgi:hypothetical protein